MLSVLEKLVSLEAGNLAPYFDLEDMAHYKLIYEYTTYFGNVYGRVFNEDGKRVASHLSSNLSWLEHDLLRDCEYNSETDTYTKNW